MLTVHIAQHDLSDTAKLPTDEEVQRWATAVYDTMHQLRDAGHKPPQAQLLDCDTVNLAYVSTSHSRTLNRDYRSSDKPTNVLSFPANLDLPGTDTCSLGDIAVCAVVVEQEAAEQKKLIEAHWCHMITHALLHLYGYDHVEPADAEHMESIEVELLEWHGYSNPYQQV